MKDEKKTKKQLLEELNTLREQMANLEKSVAVNKRAKEFFRAVTDYTHDWDYWISPEEKFIYMSPSCEEVTGYTVEDFEKDPDLLDYIVHPDDQCLISLSYENELDSDHSNGIDFRIITKDGEERWINHYCRPIPDIEGKTHGIRANNRDITDRKNAEKAVQDILDSTNQGFLQIDNQVRLLRINLSLCKILGRKEDEIIGHHLSEFLDEENKGINRHQLIQRDKLESGVYELAFTRPDNSQVTCLMNATPTYDAKGMKSGSFSLVQDISSLKQMELDLRTAKRQAESANRAKTYFLANMSHEIRTPLNSIVGFSQILIKQASQLSLPDDFQHYLENIQTGGENLSELINNILDLSKIEADKITLTRESINLKLLVQGIFHINKTEALKKNVTFQYELDPRLPKYIYSDRTKLHQILMNLVSNAIKFSPNNKTVMLRVKRQRGELVFEVEDEGIGIPKNRQSHVFEAFEQVDESMTRRYGGTGLGLYIVRKMTDLLEGEIELASEEEKGSLFTVKIPLQETDSINIKNDEVHWEDCHFSKNNKVLVIEDDPTNMEMIEVLFRELGLKIEKADNGKRGVEKALELKPDLILMDMHMPEIDGMEATRQIRENELGENIPIVAVSADAFIRQQNAAYQAGVSHYLTKPLDFKRLIPILLKYLRQEKTQILPDLNQRNRPDLPETIREQLHEETVRLSKIPRYDALGIKLQVQKMMELSKPYDSSYDDILPKIIDASKSRNSKKIPVLIKEILNG